MDNLIPFLKLLKEWGLPVGFIIAVFLVVILFLFPDRAEKWGRIIIKPFFLMKKWFGRAYVSRTISAPVNDFFNKEVLSHIDDPELKKVKVKLNFISSTDQLSKKRNTFIVRLNEDNDQTKNILSAASLLIPSVICPLVRSNIDPELSKAIDLTALKKFAEKLGKHAKYVYKTRFLDPELLENPKVNDYIEKLVCIDDKGLFISIFANELHYLGEEAFAVSDRSNRTEDVISFLEFLIKIAERSIGDLGQLGFHSTSINVGIILLAISEKAKTYGLTPYLKRLRTNFTEGCESVYVVAFPNAWGFLSAVLKAVSQDHRYKIVKSYRAWGKVANEWGAKIALIKTNEIWSDDELANKLAELGISVGTIIDGKITDVSRERAVVNFAGLNGIIEKSECSWYSILSCANELDVDQRYRFLVKNINNANGSIELSRRFPDDDPWAKVSIPNAGDIIDIRIQVPFERHLVGRTPNGIEVKVPLTEIVWGELQEQEMIELIGTDVKAMVLLVQEKDRLIRASIRQLSENPWEEVKANFPVGTRVLGTVVAVNEQFATVEVSGGICGRVTKESFLAAGHEYKDFQKNLVIGQKLQVQVSKVWVAKQKMTLELTRNLEGRAQPSTNGDGNSPEHKIIKMKPLKSKK